MNTLLLLAQGAANMADSLATANPVLTTVNAPAEMNMHDSACSIICGMFLYFIRAYVCYSESQ